MRRLISTSLLAAAFLLFFYGCVVSDTGSPSQPNVGVVLGGWHWPPEKISDCEGIGERSDLRFSETSCYISLAGTLNDSSVCSKISGPDAALQECLLAAAKGKLDASACESLNSTNREMCIAYIAKTTGNYKPCFSINAPFRHNCLYSCGFEGAFDCSENGQVATEGKNTYVFFPVGPAYSPNSCEHLTNMSGNSVFEGCNELFFGNDTLEGNGSSGSEEKEYCNKRQLYTECQTLTRDICTGILGNYVYERQACLSAMAEWSMDPSYCEKVTEEAGRAQCYYQYSLYYADEAACKRIGNRTYPEVLYSGAFYGNFSQSDCMTVVGYFK